jgi:hypothetical protein
MTHELLPPPTTPPPPATPTRAPLPPFAQATTLPDWHPPYPLLASVNYYLTIGLPYMPLRDTRILAMLPRHGLHLPKRPDPLQTLLSSLVEGHLETSAVRERRKQRVAGGWRYPNRFTPADLQQYRHEPGSLALATYDELYLLLQIDAPQVLRLARAAGRAYQVQREGWEARHVAAVTVWLRLYEVAVELAARGGEWLAEICLRRVFRDQWQEQFGAGVPYPGVVKEWLEPLPVTPELAAHVVALFEARGALCWGAPLPFAELVVAWRAGAPLPSV